MDFAPFDKRGYPVVGVVEGYGRWAEGYDGVVRDEMDLRLLDRLTCIDWPSIDRAVDLACGTGRTGAWLRGRGVRSIDGVDVTPAMLDRARTRGVYDTLVEADLRDTPFESRAYALATASLVDEHLPDVGPLYAEAARLLRPGGRFLIVGYHPQFLATVGMPTHFHPAGGEPVAIETHLHLLSDHVAAARRVPMTLVQMAEGLIDDEYVAAKPKWAPHRGLPISFAMAWEQTAVRMAGG